MELFRKINQKEFEELNDISLTKLLSFYIFIYPKNLE